jgi:UDP-N-acetylmuramoylalanine--D-glutamate ligase
MEQVAQIERVIFINDSKATNADSTDKALASFQSGIYWIAGGQPKSGGITSLAAHFGRIARAYLIGEAEDEFARTLEGHVDFVRCGKLETAVAQAAHDATAGQHSEAIVLFSPACASFDQFRNFEDRGNAFRRIVEALPEVQGSRRAR